jgi:hypothetical protein
LCRLKSRHRPKRPAFADQLAADDSSRRPATADVHRREALRFVSASGVPVTIGTIAKGGAVIFNRHLLLMTLLAGAVAVPYVTNSEQGQKLWAALTGSGAGPAAHESVTGPGSPATAAVAMPAETTRHSSHESPTGPPPETQVEGSTPQTLEEVLRFDIAPTWITERWPRVSTGLSELDLQGYRVALVTGTNDSDLAGALTYYFNKKKEVERIIFHGASGDPRRLVQMVTSRFELKQQKSDDPGLTVFAHKRWGKSVSELRIRPAAVMRSEMPHARYEIDLAIKRP